MTQVCASMPFMDERVQQQIKITKQADAAIEAVRAELGMTKLELLSRVCQWFAGQPPMVRKLVLGLIDEELKPAAGKVLIQRLVNPEPTATEKAQDAEVDRELDGKGKLKKGRVA